MNKERLAQLELLERCYNRAISVCDPLEFPVRQRNLTLAVANFLLQELQDYKEKQRTIGIDHE